jgi:DNA-binding NtrC family response regulator
LRDPLNVASSFAGRLAWDAKLGGAPQGYPAQHPLTTQIHVPSPNENDLQITPVRSGREALDLLRVFKFELVLIGADALSEDVPRLVRRIGVVSPHVRSIVVSGRLSADAEAAIREAGVVAVLDSLLPLAQLYDLASRVAARRWATAR